MHIGMKFSVICFLLLVCPLLSMTQPHRGLFSKVRKYRKNHEHAIIKEFVGLVSIPNVSHDAVNIRKNAAHIKEMMEARGIKARIMETKGNPVVFGELKAPHALRTLMFYVHYDGQPVDPSQWTETHPFKPALRPGKLNPATTEPKPIPFPAPEEEYHEDWRIYARGTSDDRAPIVGILTALDALKEKGISLKNNLKFILDGEEEAGSLNLRAFLEKNRELLSCDILFMCDGPAYYSGDPTLFFGVRGITGLDITVYGPNTSVHSGHYGNWIPNPAALLSHLLASLRDPGGRVMVKGFYDTVVPLSDFEKKALEAIPSYEADIKSLYGFSAEETNWQSLMEAIQYPALNINGIQSGWVGDQSRTIIPPSATASLDIRLVKGNDPEDMVQKVITHIQSLGYHVVESEPNQEIRMKYPLITRVVGHGGYRALRTPMGLPLCQRVIKTLAEHSEKKPVLLPSLGGSLPLYMFDDLINAPIIGVPVANHDNNQHQPDENIRIGHLWRAIETYAALIMLE